MYQGSLISFTTLWQFGHAVHLIFKDGCISVPDICTVRDEVVAIQATNEQLREYYSTNYTAALTEYITLRNSLYKYVGVHASIRHVRLRNSLNKYMYMCTRIKTSRHATPTSMYTYTHQYAMLRNFLNNCVHVHASVRDAT